MNESAIKDQLIGKKIEKIFMDEDSLRFNTNQGPVVYTVEGDCCSQSVFYDFYGVKDLIGKTIKDVKEVELNTDTRMDGKNYQEEVQVYGYQLFYDHEYWNDRTTVFSFRNYSNGYYGGSMNSGDIKTVIPQITDDVIMTKDMN